MSGVKDEDLAWELPAQDLNKHIVNKAYKVLIGGTPPDDHETKTLLAPFGERPKVLQYLRARIVIGLPITVRSASRHKKVGAFEKQLIEMADTDIETWRSAACVRDFVIEIPDDISREIVKAGPPPTKMPPRRGGKRAAPPEPAATVPAGSRRIIFEGGVLFPVARRVVGDDDHYDVGNGRIVSIGTCTLSHWVIEDPVLRMAADDDLHRARCFAAAVKATAAISTRVLRTLADIWPLPTIRIVSELNEAAVAFGLLAKARDDKAFVGTARVMEGCIKTALAELNCLADQPAPPVTANGLRKARRAARAACRRWHAVIKFKPAAG